MLSGCGYFVSFSPGRMIGPEDNEKYYKVGKSYKIEDKWYHPKEDFHYNEVGIASWYGPDFHGGDTANGEVFNKYALTAAHKTLPMPSMVKVTNLENGNWVKVRVNDRGPFVGNRIIDVSKAAAEKLGFVDKGTAKVRVQLLKEETEKLFPATSSIRTKIATSQPLPKQTTSPQKKYLKTGKTIEAHRPHEGEKIYIQVGAYTAHSKAQNYARKLGELGKTDVAQAYINGANYYRVRLGPIQSSKTADKLLYKVANHGFPEAYIVLD